MNDDHACIDVSVHVAYMQSPDNVPIRISADYASDSNITFSLPGDAASQRRAHLAFVQAYTALTRVPNAPQHIRTSSHADLSMGDKVSFFVEGRQE